MYLARELTSLSLSEIARGFNRDHTTVLHAVRSVSARLEPGSETAETIHRIRATLGREHGSGPQAHRQRIPSTGGQGVIHGQPWLNQPSLLAIHNHPRNRYI